MKVLIKEKLSPHKSKTPEGYLICRDAIIARTGTQDYYATELYPDWKDEDKIISVMRKPEEVFSDATIASFENKPITCEHPDEDVTPENHKEYSVGFARDIRRAKVDGEDVLIGNLIITDSDIINDIENGIRTELSCGYNCDITDGDKPEQINIRGNHIALCEKGRAGNAKIVDSLDDAKESEPAYNQYLKEIEDLAFDSRSAVENATDREKELFDIYVRLDTLVHNSRGPRQDIAVQMANGIVERLKKTYNLKGKGLIKFKMNDSILKLPQADKHKLQRILANRSGFTRGDLDITELIDRIEEETGYTLIREKIDGWNQVAPGVKYKDYVFSLKEYPDSHILITLYSDDDDYKTTEVNAYVTDSIEDKLIRSGSKEALKKNIATEIEAGKDPKQAVAIAYSIKEKNDSVEDDFKGEIIDQGSTFDTYRGYDIEIDPDGYYILNIEQFPIIFESHEEAVKYIDEYLDKTSAMIRDYAIRARDTQFPELEKEIKREVAKKVEAVKNEEEPEDTAAKRQFKKAKKSLLQELREQLLAEN